MYSGNIRPPVTYEDSLKFILEHGSFKSDRTGTGTTSYFGLQLRFDLEKSFPAITTKKLAWKSVVSELLWFLEGSGDERRLSEILFGSRSLDKTTIWTANAKSSYWLPKAQFDGDLGRVYGVQWRDFNGVDQISSLIEGIKKDPDSRRHMLTAWNPAELNDMALPPCHVLSQYYVNNNKLSCQMYQRSCDMFLGVPFNIASYSLLTHIIARECGLEVGEFIWVGGDCHIYSNHVEQVKIQLDRDIRPFPQLVFEKKEIKDYVVDDFNLLGYDPHPTLQATMAV